MQAVIRYKVFSLDLRPAGLFRFYDPVHGVHKKGEKGDRGCICLV
ncbi:MAG: hypothetical protein Q8N82_05465 [Deltaproteobacteria bacterium]|nr:hypothetical protein [Deltaproteobacteria bacterium]